MGNLKRTMDDLKKEIDEDDERFKNVVKQAEVAELLKSKSAHAPVLVFKSMREK